MNLYYIVECEYESDYTHEENVICVSDDELDLEQKCKQLNQKAQEKLGEDRYLDYQVKRVVKPRSDIWPEDFELKRKL